MDKYPNFAALAAAESEDSFLISVRPKGSTVVIVAPHGGGIEPGTSEIACAIAGEDFSYYLFEGTKTNGNSVLHLTSSNFDEPRCLCLLRTAQTVVTIHGEESKRKVVYLGGRDSALIAALRCALKSHDFAAETHSDPNLQGKLPSNICNIGRSRKGVQLELSKGLRRSFFASLDHAGRRQATGQLGKFSEAVRQVLLLTRS